MDVSIKAVIQGFSDAVRGFADLTHGTEDLSKATKELSEDQKRLNENYANDKQVMEEKARKQQELIALANQSIQNAEEQRKAEEQLNEISEQAMSLIGNKILDSV